MHQLESAIVELSQTQRHARQCPAPASLAHPPMAPPAAGDARIPALKARCRELIELIEAQQTRQLMPDRTVTNRLEAFRMSRGID